MLENVEIYKGQQNTKIGETLNLLALGQSTIVE
jgi:hypothetical protein